ncbi:MAG: hypothetical protein AB7P40_30375, partial [Chloroflexota bacterium]
MAVPRWSRILTGLVALAMALFVSTSALAQPVIGDDVPLTAEQEAAIRDEMAALAQVLVQGGKTPQEAKLAVNAVGICLGTAFSQGLTRAQAETVCGLVLDAFTIQPGTILYTLTPEDRAWIASRVDLWTSQLAALLEPEQVQAVQSTMQACLEGHMRRGEDREESVKSCALGLMPLLNKPE